MSERWKRAQRIKIREQAAAKTKCPQGQNTARRMAAGLHFHLLPCLSFLQQKIIHADFFIAVLELGERIGIHGD